MIRNGLKYTATVSWFDGRLAEVFVGNHKCACAKDAGVVASLALQQGVPLEVIRKALLRDLHGRPSTPIGVALDLLAAE